MALKIIGAGFGRTGTDSMKAALEQLGFGPCHHMKELLADPEQMQHWRWIAAGNTPDWNETFANYRSAVDWPSAFYWRELAANFPGAKVLLTLRSAESWHESFSRTILPVLEARTTPESVGTRVILEGVFGGRGGDRAHAIACFERNTAAVMAAIPPERLLVYHVGDGWEPLCRFLDQPVPATPFPRKNSAEEFQAMVARIETGGKP